MDTTGHQWMPPGHHWIRRVSAAGLRTQARLARYDSHPVAWGGGRVGENKTQKVGWGVASYPVATG